MATMTRNRVGSGGGDKRNAAGANGVEGVEEGGEDDISRWGLFGEREC
jgi:hypothetical protein